MGLLFTPEEQRTHPYLSQVSDFPPFDQLDAEGLGPAIEMMLERVEQEFVKHESAQFQPTWEGTFELLAPLEDALERPVGRVNHLLGVRNSTVLREAYDKVRPRVVQLGLRIQQSQPLYQALRQLRDDQVAYEALGQAKQRALDQRVKSMERAGVGLAPGSPEQKRFGEIKQRQSQLSTDFSNHVLDATKEFQLLVTDVERLAGCTPELRAQMAENAKKRDHPEATAEKGPWVLTLDYPVYGPFLMTCRDRDLRFQAFRASVTRASSGANDNTPLVTEILQLRQEVAQLLGYRNYADLSLSYKMAQAVEPVQALMDELYEAALPKARQECATLTEFATTELGMESPLQPWDTSYVSEQYRKKRFQYDENTIAQYFPFPKVLAGLFTLTKELFGVGVEEITEVATTVPGLANSEHTEIPSKWHPDVKLFRVFDANSGNTLAYFYGDFYCRPEDKNGGAWMNICTTRRRDLATNDIRYPIAYLICNQPNPLADKPSLMKFRDVQTLFHEFGHCMQHMLTTMDLPDVSGLNGVEWDFIEVASQFMENFCYESEWLARISEHYQTKEPMPTAMVEALQREREFQQGLPTMRQIHFSLTDMALHSTYDSINQTRVGPKEGQTAGEKLTPFDIDSEIGAKTRLFPAYPEDRFLCAFTHIFAGGYSAGYYSYKWSEVYSADAYDAIAEASTPEARRAACKRYRDTVLSLGGGTPPREVWTQFRGRPEASAAALVRQCGLDKI
ncbi:hypothetical protein BJ085DRAFT_22744 [Dimargaris cristalligena]|uniref:oligopeptidase A n=1 Tax=Dimargaris cristalligena TaxID=215637 RepID=A0A4P9ZRL3_9FUNG|nr:hypothetical protein BJ085DRAFT_22744 [Dimargaris cristalligena]|eukprot:RKP35391.1 hypothetical protein BJ085DRAFT_22744 [Dimargaris cristalligena]